MSRILIRSIGLVAIGVWTSCAAVIYNNGPSNLSDAANITSYVAADDFTLSAPANVQLMTISSSADTDPYPEFSNNMDWAILSNNNGIPGAIIFSGSSPVSSFEDTGNQILGTEEFQLGIYFHSGSYISLLGGTTYWLALAVDPNGNLSQQVYWDSTSAMQESVAMSTTDTSLQSGWVPALSGMYGTDLAFTLSGPSASQSVPDPDTSGLSVVGLFAVVSYGSWRAKAQERSSPFAT
jgi:hypothetical protein